MKGNYILANKQKEFFGIHIYNFIILNIRIVILSIPIGLCFGLCPIVESNFLKHIFWGIFSYSSIALFLIVILHILKGTDNIIKTTMITSLVLSILMAFIYEVESIDIIHLSNQFLEVCIDIVGSIIIFIINYHLYSKTEKGNKI